MSYSGGKISQHCVFCDNSRVQYLAGHKTTSLFSLSVAFVDRTHILRCTIVCCCRQQQFLLEKSVMLSCQFAMATGLAIPRVLAEQHSSLIHGGCLFSDSDIFY